MSKNKIKKQLTFFLFFERFERRGYKLNALKLFSPSKALLEEHYGEHKGKPFFEPLVN